MRIMIVLLFAVLTIPFEVAQQKPSQDATPESTKPVTSRKDKKQPTPAPPITPDKSTETGKLAEPAKAESSETNKNKDKEEHYGVAEVPPLITHHQVALNGKTLSYTATAGRLPIKRGNVKIEAEM